MAKIEILNACNAACCGNILKGQTAYDPYLEANHDPKELDAKWKR